MGLIPSPKLPHAVDMANRHPPIPVYYFSPNLSIGQELGKGLPGSLGCLLEGFSQVSPKVGIM